MFFETAGQKQLTYIGWGHILPWLFGSIPDRYLHIAGSWMMYCLVIRSFEKFAQRAHQVNPKKITRGELGLG